MKRMLILCLSLCLLLSGCSLLSRGSYSSATPHTEPSDQQNRPAIEVSDYAQLCSALTSLVAGNADRAMLTMLYDDEEVARQDMEDAVADVLKNDPFTAYAVEDIRYDFGASGGRKGVSVQIFYYPNRVRIDKIQRVKTLDQVQQIVSQRLDACDADVVLYFDNPENVDYVQMVADYALTYPQRVMEAPEVSVNLYPEEGQQQVVELKFTYQTSRVELRTLQNKVAPVFSSALQHVSGNRTDTEKAMRLYSFLMDRYEYNIQTSITPAYSLLQHGVGDCRAFAMVYAAMCRQADVECRVVTGTRSGESWVWNALQIDGEYYYLDLLRCNSEDRFRLYSKDEMYDYVWDYSAYPAVAEEIS